MEQKQEVSKDIPSKDKKPSKVSSLLLTWNPELEEPGSPVPQKVKADPYADAWEMMRDKGVSIKAQFFYKRQFSCLDYLSFLYNTLVTVYSCNLIDMTSLLMAMASINVKESYGILDLSCLSKLRSSDIF